MALSLSIKTVSSKANSKQKEKEKGGWREAGLTSLVLGADTGAVLSVLYIRVQEEWRVLGRKQHAEGSRNVSTVAVAASPALFQQEVRSSMCERVCQSLSACVCVSVFMAARW